MSFIVIQQKKKIGQFGTHIKKELFTVPNSWFKGDRCDGILLWPRKYKSNIIESLRKDKFSVPEPDWEEQKAVLRSEPFSSFEEAEQEEIRLCGNCACFRFHCLIKLNSVFTIPITKFIFLSQTKVILNQLQQTLMKEQYLLLGVT